MATRPLPDAEYLRQCFDYDPDTGVLTWRERPPEHFPDLRAWKIWNTRFVGKRAGTPLRRYVGILNHPYTIHRVIWKLVTGDEPPEQIDHMDQDWMNNRWANLRGATQYQNQRNRGAQRNNLAGLKGVSRDRSGHYYARLTLRGVPTRIGTFQTAEAAHAAYCDAARVEYGEFWSAGTTTARLMRPGRRE